MSFASTIRQPRPLADRTNASKSATSIAAGEKSYMNQSQRAKSDARDAARNASLRQRQQRIRTAEEKALAESMTSAAEVESAAARRHARSESAFIALQVSDHDVRPPFRPTSPSGAGPIPMAGLAQFRSSDAFPLYSTPALAHKENFAVVSPPSKSPYHHHEKQQRQRGRSASPPTRLPPPPPSTAMYTNENNIAIPAPSSSRPATSSTSYVNSTFARKQPRQPLYPPPLPFFRGNAAIPSQPADSQSTTDFVQRPLSAQPSSSAAQRSMSQSVRPSTAAPSLSIRVSTGTPAPSPLNSGTGGGSGSGGSPPPPPLSSSSSVSSRGFSLRSKPQLTSKEQARRTLLKSVRALRREAMEAEKTCNAAEENLSSIAGSWQSSRTHLAQLCERAAVSESEALAIQENQRAEVTTYQHRVLALVARNKQQALEVTENATKDAAEMKVVMSQELERELHELSELEAELHALRGTHARTEADLEASRATNLSHMVQHVEAEVTLRTFNLDRSYAAKEAALLEGLKQSLVGAGRNQDRIESGLVAQHERSIQEAKKHAQGSMQARVDQIKFLQDQLQRSRIQAQQHELKLSTARTTLHDRTERLDSLHAEETQLELDLSEALQDRNDLDHSNAQILMLHDRCNAWYDCIGTLEAMRQNSEKEAQLLQQAFQDLLENLKTKNATMTTSLQQQALEHYERIKQTEAERKQKEEEMRAKYPQPPPPWSPLAAANESSENHEKKGSPCVYSSSSDRGNAGEPFSSSSSNPSSVRKKVPLHSSASPSSSVSVSSYTPVSKRSSSSSSTYSSDRRSSRSRSSPFTPRVAAALDALSHRQQEMDDAAAAGAPVASSPYSASSYSSHSPPTRSHEDRSYYSRSRSRSQSRSPMPPRSARSYVSASESSYTPVSASVDRTPRSQQHSHRREYTPDSQQHHQQQSPPSPVRSFIDDAVEASPRSIGYPDDSFDRLDEEAQQEADMEA